MLGTSNKNLKDALRKSESRFRTLIEALGEGILYCNPEDIIIHVNSRLVELTGYQVDEMIGQPAYELLLPSGEDRLLRDRTARRLQGISESYEIQLRRKDGTRFWAEIHATPIREEAGDQIVGTLGALTNIDERKSAEESLKKSERKYRDLVETSSDVIWSLDQHAIIVFVNQAALAVYGYEPEEMIGRPFTDFVSEQQAVKDIAVFHRVLGGEPHFKYETEHLRKDGSTVALSINAKQRQDRDGNVVGTTGTATDITEKQRSEKIVRRREKQFRTYFQLPLIGIAISSAEGEWIDVNEKLCEIHGYPREELMRLSWEKITHPDDLAADLALLAKVNAGEIDRYSMDKRFIKKNGEIIHTSMSLGCVRTNDGAVDYHVVLVQDITDRVRMEAETIELQRQLMQSQKMDAIGQLAAGIAHDLNNALGAVVGHLQLMRLDPELPENSERSVDIALSGCSRATSLIEQLLGFSRQGKYNLKTVSLQQLVTETLDFLSRVLEKNIYISRINSKKEIFIKADQAQLQQAITNLIINAKQSMPSGGTIIISMDSQEVRNPAQFNHRSSPGQYAVLSIQDSGVGIPSDIIDKIFEPFFTTKDEGGTGLGLSMVYGTVQNHGGWIQVQSVPGNGSTFEVYLPIVTMKEVSPTVSITHDAATGTGAILIVDDEPHLADLTQQFLQQTGYGTKSFTSGEAAVAWYKLNSSEIDLIILDMKMPGMDGKACFEAMRKINPDASVVILTGYIRDDTAKALLQSGVIKVFQKPVKYPDLIQWVNGNLRARKI